MDDLAAITLRAVQLLRQLTALGVTLGVVASGCKDDASPTAPTPGTAGATQVRGTERLAWDQIGDVARLKFRAYVDDKAVDLPGATCTSSATVAACTSPLPALSDGVHTIALVNVSIASGSESERTASITLQKVSGRATASSLPLAFARSGGLRLTPVITLADDLAYTADIVATGIRAPAQMSWLPGGRLLVSDADGRVRVVRPGEPENHDPALDAAMLTSNRIGPMGLANHPDFARNRFVYVSLLEQERKGTRLRVVRLREVGDTLGEPATLFEAAVADDGTASQAGPRMAFGPDRLLYVMLPPGLEFVNEPGASAPRASMLRLTDEGRAASGEPLSGITSTPLAFAWSPESGALWVMLRGANGEAAVRALEGQGRARVMRAEAPAIRAREGAGSAAGTLLVESAPNDLLVARLALPVQTVDGFSDRVGDIVAGEGGTLFVVTNNGLVNGVAGSASDVVVRLTPVPASPAR